jgi:hypothetical protein
VPWPHDRKIEGAHSAARSALAAGSGIICHMGAGEGVSAAPDGLIGREAEAVVDSLSRGHPRTLADNPDGVALLGDAVRRAIRLGLDAGCERAGRAPVELDFGRADAWERWQRQRDRTPEARAWPAELAATDPGVVADARELLVAAGRELGMHGRSSRAVGDAGAQAAEAGAALARALAEPAPVPGAPPSGTVAPLGAVQPDGTVRVAVAANQAEAELLQGVLEDAGIPSTWRRTGGDLPELLAAGYREIYVPAAAAGDAQALLATLETPDSEQDPAPTRRIGLERTGLRLIGKATAILVVVSILISVAVGLVTDEPTLGLVALLAILAAGVAILVWSERAGRA